MLNERINILYACERPDLLTPSVSRRLRLLLGNLDRERFAPALFCTADYEFFLQVPPDVPVAWKDSSGRMCGDVEPESLPQIIELVGTRKLPSGLRAAGAALVKYLDAELPEGLWQRLLERYLSRRTDRFIVPSEAFKDYLSKHGFAQAKIRVVHMPPVPDNELPCDNTAVLQEWRNAVPGNGPLLGTVCESVNAPELLTFLDAAGKIQHKFPDARFAVFIASGPETLPRVQTVPAGLSLPLIMVTCPAGYLSPELLVGLDVFIYAKTDELSTDITVTAMAAGVPIAAGCAPGCIEALAEGDYGGLTVNSGSTAAFARAAILILREPELQRRLTASGKQRAADFSLERLLSRTAEVYTDLAMGIREGRE